MIVSKLKPIPQILKSIENLDNIFILGCGTCSTTCKSGGEEEVARIKQELLKIGKKISGTAVCETPCVASQIKITLAKNRKALEQTKAVLILACGSGVQSTKDNDRMGLKMLPGCDTLFAAALDAKNEFKEYCSHCSECVLDVTNAICPITRCAKGLLNGPCGGMNKGKCEVDKDKDCAWVLIYDEAKKFNELSLFKKVQSAKDHSKSVKPHKLILES
jgi:hypothetical protein